MKYWRGYICAAIFAALTGALMAFAESHSKLIDMIYPYATRLIQTTLTGWTGTADFCLWQLIVMVLGVMALASIVIMVIMRWNFFQWMGWVLAICSFVFMMHTGIYGLNSHAGPLTDDIRLEKAKFTVTELAEATDYFLQVANELSTQVPRTDGGGVDYPDFDTLAGMAKEGFDYLAYEKYYAVFAGSTDPVKKLGWADLYSSMGITGVSMPLTGEAAVNPQIPAVSLPFTMAHEMCHRMCIALERDANLGAFLVCDAHSDPVYRYSGYFMAFRYCYNALYSYGTATARAAAAEIYAKVGPEMLTDLNQYNEFFASRRNETADKIGTAVNDTYIQVSGDESGVQSYSEVYSLLVSWYIQEIYLPLHQEEVIPWDPTDKNQVDLRENLTVGG